jgi:hypothetical protein
MSWHFSRALVEASSAANCSDGVPSAPSSSSPTHGMCWSPGRMTEASSPSRSGMTYAHSTESHGEALLTWCLEGSRVRTSPAQEQAPVWRDLVRDSGGRWHESSARYDPDTSSWKTRQCSLLAGSESFSETWPRWGLMLDGVSWALSMPGRLTEGNGSGSSLPTPTASEGGRQRSKSPGAAVRPSSGMMAKRDLWPTPTCGAASHSTLSPEAQARELERSIRDRGGPSTLAIYVQAGMSPSMQKHPGCRAMWPTPNTMDHMSPRSDEALERAKTVGGCSNLKDQPEIREAGGSLNPTWVEWLMGWPLGWTACEPSEMDRFRRVRPWPGGS